MGPRAGLDGSGENYLLPPSFEPGTIQPRGSRFTNYTIPVLDQVFELNLCIVFAVVDAS